MLKLLSTLACTFMPMLCEASPATTPGDIVLTTTNSYTFRGEVTGESISKAEAELVRLNKDRASATYPLYLVLDSPGGSIYAGLSFIEFLQTIPNLNTITIFAASMASGIVEATPGKRYITRVGILMFHRAKGGFQGQFEQGEIESELKLWQSIVLTMEQASADRIGISLAAYKAHAMVEWWLLGREAVQEGAADQVVRIKCTQRLIDSTATETIEGLFTSQDVKYSKCPLFQAPL